MRLDYTFVFQILNFVALFLLLRRYFFRPAKAYLERRARHVSETLRAAEDDRKRALQLKEESELELSRARAKASEIVEEARRASEEIRANARRLAAEESARVTARAREEASRQKERVLREIRGHILDLSVAIASRAIRDTVDAATLREAASAAARDILQHEQAREPRGGKAP